MAADKLVDSAQLDSDLEDVADAIRTKGGTSASLAFPSGFITAIQNISTGSTGADYVSGSFTVPASGSSYTLNFGKTFSKYLFVIEANSDAKDAIKGTGLNGGRAYAWFGVKPVMQYDGANVGFIAVAERVNPSTSAYTVSNVGSLITLGDSSITMNTYDKTNTNAANYLYYGLTYNYYVYEIT